MPNRSLWTLAIFVVTLCPAGCVRRIPEPATTDDTPHVSWVLRAGPEFGYGEEVCRSDPRSDCVLTSSGAAKNFATMSLYLHPTTASTAYRGSLEVTFFETASGIYGTPVDRTVEPGDPPVALSVSGLVKQQPGQSVAAIALIAYPSGQVAREIREAVSVIAK